MGCTNSKSEKDEALRLCKDRRRLIKQAIESRYALAAAHVSYVKSLRNIGVALRRFAEAELLIESSLSISDKTPSHSSYPSPSPSHLNDASDSPVQQNQVSVSPVVTRLSYMRAGGGGNGGASAVTVRLNPASDGFVEEFLPPPPPFAGGSGSWDFFDPVDENGNDNESGHSFSFAGNHHGADSASFEGFNEGFEEVNGGTSRAELERKRRDSGNRVESSRGSGKKDVNFSNDHCVQASKGETKQLECRSDGGLTGKLTIEQCGSKMEKDLSGEREDPSEFITHRAKDLLSSIKDIEHRFFRASESGNEVLRMLEANKIRVGYSEAKGKSSALAILQALQIVVCCHGQGVVVSHESLPQGKKVITWKRTTSSRSSSSRNPLASSTKDDGNDSGSDFVEEFCMIAGSHSSTLDRLYAWERKLYDEVKASESIRKEYDQKCEQLRYMFAKDYSSQVIDKTRAVVKDLHSRIRVAIHSVDSISKRIEKMRDEELHPQLVELTQGLIRMWKSMLECHHAQYITITLAYHSKNMTGTPRGDAHKQIVEQLLQEVECFGLSFADWINSLTSYVEALNCWLNNSILPPRERFTRRPFSPRRYLGPPIFSLCRDWVSEIRALPSEELIAAIRTFLSDLHRMTEQQLELQKITDDAKSRGSEGNKDDNTNENENSGSNLSCVQATLTKVLDRLTKFSEASLKMYEDLKQKNEAARVAYLNCRSQY